jgi:hypothetical protein
MLSMPRIVRPDLFRSRETEFGSPVESATRRSIKRNKELAGISDAVGGRSSIPPAVRQEKNLIATKRTIESPARNDG